MNNPETFHSEPGQASGMPTGTIPIGGEQSTESSSAIQSEVEKAKQLASDKVQSTVDQAKAEAENARELAEGKFEEVRSRARSAGQSIVDEKKRQISGQLGMVTDALNRTSEKLHQDQHGAIAHYADFAAEKVESVRHSIESKDVGDLIDDVQSFTRRQPGLVFGGLFIAGLAAMRFMKASSQECTERQVQRAREQAGTADPYGRTLSPQQASVVTRQADTMQSRYN